MRQILLLGLLVLPHVAGAQKKQAREAALQQQLAVRHYTFHAGFIQPMRGGQRQLTEDYSVDVRKDSVTAWLPYIGVAQMAPVNAEDGGIKFTSTNFRYSATQKKNGNWQITIKPADVADVQRLDFTISTDGTASLYVTRITADEVGFTGDVNDVK